MACKECPRSRAPVPLSSLFRVNLLWTDEALKLAPVGCWFDSSIRMAYLNSPLAEP